MARQPKLISIKMAAEILAIAPKTIYNWHYSGSSHLEFVKLGGSLRVVEDSVYRLIERSTVPLASSPQR